MPKKIAVVGAGPKAAALVARAAALRTVLPDASLIPELVIFEKDAVGAAWSGDGQFSSGFLELCTAPEKDVGFPYHEADCRPGHKRAIASEIFGRFSWQAHRIAVDLYSEWVDRGRRHPSHAQWAAYLRWVFAEAGVKPVFANVNAIRPRGKKWSLDYSEAGQAKTISVDGVVITGTGAPRIIPAQPGIPADRLLDSESFWPNRGQVKLGPDRAIAVVGDGGGAGAIIGWLADRYAEEDVSIISISPAGTLFPRGDGYAERRWFSDPTEWSELEIEDRENILKRTEAGVISARNKKRIDRSPLLTYVRGHAGEVVWNGYALDISVTYRKRPAPSVEADYLVSAVGFDSWTLLQLVDHPNIADILGPSDALRKQIRIDFPANLAMPPVSRLPDGLHVPALADLAQGPGMGNLGCLGLMAAAILDDYIS